MRIGMGYDVHRLVSGRDLILGGIKIPFEKGLLGHSDADVILHALCDALLGAAGLEDIGVHFPDTDPRYQGIDSGELLKKTVAKIREKGFYVVNADCTLFAQAPKIGPYRGAMRERIARLLDIPTDRANIKATTTERLGTIGQGEGMAAMCVVLIESDKGHLR